MSNPEVIIRRLRVEIKTLMAAVEERDDRIEKLEGILNNLQDGLRSISDE